MYGYTKLAKWHEKVNQSGFKTFNTLLNLNKLCTTIFNYVDIKSNNALAVLFNVKIKAFKSKFREVRTIAYPKQISEGIKQKNGLELTNPLIFKKLLFRSEDGS